jgi:uncharacterized membrane protein
MSGLSVATLTACSPDSVNVVGLSSGASLSIAATSISVAYLPQPEGAVVYDAGLSAGGMIFGKTSSVPGPVRPWVWTSPYTTPPIEIAAEGFIGGLDDANDNGDIRGESDGAGFWARDGAGWRFAYVDCGVYVGVTVSGVNNTRAISGWGSVNGAQKALWWDNEFAQPNELPTPSVAGTVTGVRALAINNNGDIVGEVREQRSSGRKTSSYSHAVLWRRSALGWETIVLNDAGTTNIAYDVNDAGQVAGNSNVTTAVLWTPSNGAYGNGVVVSSSQGALTHVDRCGRVIGYTHTNTPNKRRAYVWENGVITQLPLPAGAIASSAQAITTDLTTGEGIILGAAQPGGSQNVNGSFRPVRWSIPGCA